MIGDLYRVILATSEPGRGSGYDTHRLIAPSYQQHMHMMTNTQIRKRLLIQKHGKNTDWLRYVCIL